MLPEATARSPGSEQQDRGEDGSLGRWAHLHWVQCAHAHCRCGDRLLLPEHTPLQPQQERSTQVLPGAFQNEDMSSRMKVTFPSCVKQLERRNPEQGQHPQNSGGERLRRGAPLLQPSLRQVHPAAFTVVWFPQPLPFVA